VNASAWSQTLPLCEPGILGAVKNDLFMELVRFASIGANLDCKDVSGELFLFLALKRCPEDTLLEIVRSYSPLSASLFSQNSTGMTPLLASVEKGFANLTMTLIQLQPNRSATDDEGRNLLHFAAPWPRLLLDLLRVLPPGVAGQQLRQRDASSNTPLHLALSHRHYDQVYEAFQVMTLTDPTLVPDLVSFSNERGERLIHLNAKQELTQVFLDAGADAAARTLYGAAPLHTVSGLPGSAVAGTLGLLFRSAEVRVSATDNQGRSPIHYAASSGDWDNVRWLLDQGADILLRDAEGQVPLQVGLAHNHYHLVPLFDAHGGSVLVAAAGFGNVSLVQELVLSGMSPNAMNAQTGRTPIFEAVEKGQIAVVEFLVAQNASLIHVDKAGLSVLAAALLARRPSAVEFLLAQRVPVEQRLANMSTALHVAAVAGLAQSITLLVRAGADPAAVDFKNRSALHLATTAAAVEVLLQSNVSLTRSAAFGLTPLHAAATEARVDVLAALLAARVGEVDEVDFVGNTPLHFAAFAGTAEAVSVLLRFCAPTTQTNDAGLLPVELAQTAETRQLLMDGSAERCECDCGPLQLDALIVAGEWTKGCTASVSCRFGGGEDTLRCVRNVSVPLTSSSTGDWEIPDLGPSCRGAVSYSTAATVSVLGLVEIAAMRLT